MLSEKRQAKNNRLRAQYFVRRIVLRGMNSTLSLPAATLRQNARIKEVVRREQRRLLAFIRKRIADPLDAEDLMQDVLAEFVAATRLNTPIEEALAWLIQVAKNRIIDRYRKKKLQTLSLAADEAAEEPWLAQQLAAIGDAPHERYVRKQFLSALHDALAELPLEQREVFIRHELEGVRFKALAAETGVTLNTLLARKRYAVLHLQARLRSFQEGGG